MWRKKHKVKAIKIVKNYLCPTSVVVLVLLITTCSGTKLIVNIQQIATHFIPITNSSPPKIPTHQNQVA